MQSVLFKISVFILRTFLCTFYKKKEKKGNNNVLVFEKNKLVERCWMEIVS